MANIDEASAVLEHYQNVLVDIPLVIGLDLCPIGLISDNNYFIAVYASDYVYDFNVPKFLTLIINNKIVTVETGVVVIGDVELNDE